MRAMRATHALLALWALAGASATLLFDKISVPLGSNQHRITTSNMAVLGGGIAPRNNDPSNILDGGFWLITNTSGQFPANLYQSQNWKPITKIGSDEPDSSSMPGFASLFQTADGSLWSLQQHADPLPAAMILYRLWQDQDMHLGPLGASNVDWSAWGGLWRTRTGNKSPWGSHLSGEVQEPNARLLADIKDIQELQALDAGLYNDVVHFMRYWGLYPPWANGASAASSATFYNNQFRSRFAPYRYGHAIEAHMDSSNSVVTTKWYTLGRLSFGNIVVMPDNLTVYVTDDHPNGGLYKFVMDNPGDLNSGSLYAARLQQKSTTVQSVGGTFMMSWVLLGQGTQSDLSRAATGNLTFYDIFTVGGGNCSQVYLEGSGPECLAVKRGRAQAAAFFETRRYAAMMGASLELNRLTGLVLDPGTKQMYTAVSSVAKAMLEDPVDLALPRDNVRLQRSPCGCLYTINVDEGYNANFMNTLHCGRPNTNSTKTGIGACTPTTIGTPSALALIGHDVLLVGEAGGGHVNPAIWALSVSHNTMVRIMNVPSGYDVSAISYQALNGSAYILASLTTPPGTGAAISQVHTTQDDGTVVTDAKNKGFMGMIGPLDPVETNLGFEAVQPQLLPVTTRIEATRLISYSKPQRVPYSSIIRDNETLGNNTYGLVLERRMLPVRPLTSDAYQSGNTTVSHLPHVMGPWRTCAGVFTLTTFERPNPGGMYVTSFAQDSVTGELTATSTRPVDWSNWHSAGLWSPSHPVRTPWGSIMTPECSEPNARQVQQAESLDDFNAQFGDPMEAQKLYEFMRYYNKYPATIKQVSDFKAWMKPYRYGWVTDTVLNSDAAVLAVKRVAMGRVGAAAVVPLPDGQNVWMFDGHVNAGIFRFGATTPGDMSSGIVYAASVKQKSDESGGSFTITWVPLTPNPVNEGDIVNDVDSLLFGDLFSTSSASSQFNCPPDEQMQGTIPVNVNGYMECLRPWDWGNIVPHALFETRRYAALQSATMEFGNGFVGAVYDVQRSFIYASVAAVELAMTDKHPTHDLSWKNDLKLRANPCGCVFMIDLTHHPSPKDPQSALMKALLCGTPLPDGTCDADNIAHPGKLVYMEANDQLLIYEQAGPGHSVPMLWSFALASGTLTRIMTGPPGASLGAAGFSDNVNGFTYVPVAVQEPYTGTQAGRGRVSEAGSYGVSSTWGYLGPIKNSARGAKTSCGFAAVQEYNTTILQSISMPFGTYEPHQLSSTQRVVYGPGFKTGFKTLAASGKIYGSMATAGGFPFDVVLDNQNLLSTPVMEVVDGKKSSKPLMTTMPSAAIMVPGVKTSFMVVPMDGSLPSALYLMQVQQDPMTGELEVSQSGKVPIDTNLGIASMSGGSATPWGSVVTYENWVPDARAFEQMGATGAVDPKVMSFARHFGIYPGNPKLVQSIAAVFNPYYYGHAIEVKIGKDGWPLPNKWYGLGRLPANGVTAMPDSMTVYIPTSVGLYRFRTGDWAKGSLSGGVLEGAYFNQTSPVGADGGTFGLSWITLGNTANVPHNDELKMVATTTVFSNIFAASEPAMDGTCAEGVSLVNVTGRPECLTVKQGYETIAAFLETARFAATKGVTTNLGSIGQFSLDPRGTNMYVPVSSMGPYASNSFVQVGHNPCGCIYRAEMNKAFSITAMTAIICGNKITAGDGSFLACSNDTFANPTGVYKMPDNDILLISEDTRWHETNYLWAYDIGSGSLTRVLSTPYGGGVGTVTVANNFNGYDYVLTSIMHPYRGYEKRASSPLSIGQVGVVGYIGPFKKPVPEAMTLMADISPPTTSTDKTQILASGKVAYGTGLGAGQFTIFSPILRDGDPMLPFVSGPSAKPPIGSILNSQGRPVQVIDLLNLQRQEGMDLVSVQPAATTVLHLSQDGLVGLVQFKETPSTQYALKLQQTCYGDLVPEASTVLDWSGLGGLWGSSQAIVTPWRTQLGGEGHEPDARAFMSAARKGDVYGFEPSVVQFMRYFGKYIPGMTVDDVTANIKPYRYGFATETIMKEDGTAELNKRLVLGRFAHEGFAIMPDGKTVYMTELRRNAGLYMFVADIEGDLTAGTLYAAKLSQADDSSGGLFRVSWIKLVTASEADVSSALPNVKFDDIFDVVVLASGDNVCPDNSYRAVTTEFGVECLRVKKGMHTAAALLETHRYASMMNATVEFEALGGLALDSVRNVLHLSVGAIEGAMLDNVGVWDVTTSNDIRLGYNPCGCVYSLNLDPSTQQGTLLRATTCGSLDASDPNMQSCSKGSIANPGALVYVQGNAAIGGDLLLVYERAETKENNMIWSYDLLSSQLIPIFHGPYDAKLGGGAFYPDINGYAYIGVSVAAPYTKHADQAGEEDATGTRSWFGTIGPIQVVDSPTVGASCHIPEAATVDALQIAMDIPNELIVQWNDYARLIKDAIAHAAGCLPRDVYIGPQFLEDPRLQQSGGDSTMNRRRELLQAKHMTTYYVGIAYPRTEAGSLRLEAFTNTVNSAGFKRIWYPYSKLRQVSKSFTVRGTRSISRVKKANLLQIESPQPYTAPTMVSGNTAKAKTSFPGGIAPGTAPATLGGGAWGNSAESHHSLRLAVVQAMVLAALLLGLWVGIV